MYVTVVPNRSSPPAILPRESFRDNGKVRNRTLGESLGLDAVDEDDLHDAISTTAGPRSAPYLLRTRKSQNSQRFGMNFARGMGWRSCLAQRRRRRDAAAETAEAGAVFLIICTMRFLFALLSNYWAMRCLTDVGTEGLASRVQCALQASLAGRGDFSERRTVS